MRRESPEVPLWQQPESPAAFSTDLPEALGQAWRRLCEAYDTDAEAPELPPLLEGADLSAPAEAAETILANMLLELAYSFSRFSPWYKRPLGVHQVQDAAAGPPRRSLTPGTREQWEDVLDGLEAAIAGNLGLILALDFLDDPDELPAGPRLLAACGCVPPHLILVSQAGFLGGITCDACGQPFHLIRLAGTDPGLSS